MSFWKARKLSHPLRRRRSRGRSRGKSAGVKALKIVRGMQKSQEKKILQAVNGTIQIPVGGAAIIEGFGPYLLQGVTQATRVGDKITVKSLAMRINVTLTALEADGTTVRLLLVYDRRPDGADAVLTDMLAFDDVKSNYQTSSDSRGRFQFLADRTITFNSIEAQWNDKYFIKRDFQTLYADNNGNVTDIERGNFLIVGLAEDCAAAINVDFGYTFRFTDD